MSDTSIRLEIILSEITSRIIALERDREHVAGINARTIEKHERAIESLEDRAEKIALEQAVANTEVQGMSKLRWIILVAIVTQLATAFASVQKPIEVPRTIDRAR